MKLFLASVRRCVSFSGRYLICSKFKDHGHSRRCGYHAKLYGSMRFGAVYTKLLLYAERHECCELCRNHHECVDLAIIPRECVGALESDILPPLCALGADTKAHALPLSYTATEGGGLDRAPLAFKRLFLDGHPKVIALYSSILPDNSGSFCGSSEKSIQLLRWQSTIQIYPIGPIELESTATISPQSLGPISQYRLTAGVGGGRSG